MRTVALFGASIWLCSCGTEVAYDLYSQRRILEVEVQLSPSDFAELRAQTRDPIELLRGDCLAQPFPEAFSYFPASVVVNGQAVENVGVRKKGFLGSLSESKPGLKIDFAEFVPGQELFGRKKLTLNNAVADPSLLRQCVTFDLFNKAGIPAPQCGFARVTVNGEDLGIYVNVETPDKRFLKGHYRDNDGNLYEGTLSDFRDGWTGTLESKTNEETNDQSDVQAIVQALDADDASLVASLEAVIDLDQFFTFWAMETLVNHADGYTGNTNNFYLYHDPRSDLFQFLPWGVDFTLAPGNFLGPDVPISVMAMGALPRRLYELPETRERYLLRLSELLDRVWDEDELLAQVDSLEALLGPAASASDVEDTRRFIQERRGAIEGELSSGAPEWPLELLGDVCLRDLGTMSGDFSTTFGTIDDEDPFANSSGFLEVLLQGEQLALSQFVSSSGLDPERPGNIIIQDVAFTDDNRAAFAFFTVPAALAQAGADIQTDLGAQIGAFFFFDLATQESELVGLLLGTLSFEQVSTADGQPVLGSFSGDLVTFPFQ